MMKLKNSPMVDMVEAKAVADINDMPSGYLTVRHGKIHPFLIGKPSIFLWAIYTMAMLVIARLGKCRCYLCATMCYKTMCGRISHVVPSLRPWGPEVHWPSWAWCKASWRRRRHHATSWDVVGRCGDVDVHVVGRCWDLSATASAE